MREREAADQDCSGPVEAGATNQGLLGFLTAAPEPALAIDGSDHIVFLNAPLARLFGYSEEELLSRHIDVVLPQKARHGRSKHAAEVLDVSGATSVAGLERVGRHKDGSEIAVEVSLTRVAAHEGNMGVCLIRDVSERRRVEGQIALSEARLNEAQRIAGIGNWEWDIVNNTDWWSDELYRILQVDPAVQRPSFALFLQRALPRDRQRVKDAVERVLARGGPYAIDVQVALPDGTERIVHTQGEVRFDSAGRPVRMAGTLHDITERKATETALRLSETRYKEAQRIAKVGNWEWDLVNDESWWSEELYRILEEEPRIYQASFDNFLSKVHPDDRRTLVDGKDDFSYAHPTQGPAEIRLVLDGGRRKIVEQRIDVRTDAHGKPAAVIGTVRDVTDRRELENQLRESEERYASTVELAAIGIAHVDPEGRFLWGNEQLCEMLDYSKTELLTLTTRNISHPDDRSISEEHKARVRVGAAKSYNVEKRYVRRDGKIIWVRITSTLRRRADGGELYDISVVEDISARKSAEARVEYLATHDELTGLPNRALFGELLTLAIESAHRHEHQGALLFIDLDRFKIVNDSLGHDAGDQLISEMGRRIRRSLRKSDVVARLGGDEFVVLLPRLDGPEAAAAAATKILHAILEPVRVSGQEFRVTASIGVAMYPRDGHDALSLLKHADVAMYQAKEEGKNNYQFYSAETAPMSVERLTLESLLGNALEQHEFSVQYQPRVSLDSGVVKGAEALLRWWNPKFGTVSPAQFIPIAEDTGLIVPIGKWVLRTACEQNVAWQRNGLPPVVMSVNLSPRQFKDAELLNDIKDVLEQTGMAAELLELEITESMIMHNAAQAAERVSAIKQLGVRLALDDFGTGYSSLSQLKSFPIDTLKIDRSFVRDIAAKAEDRAIIEAIVSLGKTLRVTVVAEGVETARQQRLLRDCACDEIQGFHFSKPCHPHAFAALLAGDRGRKTAQ